MGAAAAPLAVGAGSAIAGKVFGGGKKNIQQVDPTRPSVGRLQDQYATFLRGLMSDPAGSSQAFTSDLQRGATSGIMQFLSQPSPEQTTFENLSPGLMNIFGRDSASAVGEAAFPLFQRGLQEGLGSLSSGAAGRFSTTFERQGIDLTQRALQDFNLLQQQAFQQNVANQLGAAGLLGNLAGQAGQNPFQRLLGAGQLGTQQTASNPILQLLLGGMNFAQPGGMDTVVGDSFLDTALKGASIGTMLPWGGGGGGGLAVPWDAGGT